MNKIEANDAEAQSADIVADNLSQLQSLFPEAFAEGKVQFDTLRQLLGGAVDEADEKYGLNWHGKRRARQIALTPSTGTLRPCPDESVDWDTTQNLMIEGDNLEVLKLLQKSYAGKVKLIYIDPPYNTGKDFVYPDNFRDSIGNYLELTGQIQGGARMLANTESSGRFHTDWLNMMYPRLKLARSLLNEDGAIFISIGEAEATNLKKICDEVFGEECFVATFVWDGGRKNDSKKVSLNHEYILAYSKTPSNEAIEADQTLWRERKAGIDAIYEAYAKGLKTYGNNWEKVSRHIQDWYRELPESDPARDHEHYRFADEVGVYFASDLSGPDDGRKNRPRYEVLHPTTKKAVPVPSRGWRWEEQRMVLEIAANRVHFGPDESSIPNGKVYLKENEWQAPSSVFYKDRRAASGALKKLMGEKVFDFPKDANILSRFVGMLCRKNDIVLDFFAGSGSAAEAVMKVASERNQPIRFILVQLPEPLEEDGRAWKMGLRTIFGIALERIRRVGKQIKSQNQMLSGDIGFRVFKLDKSNIREWSPDLENLTQSLLDHHEHILEGRIEADIVYELLLKLGLDLCVPMESRTVAGKTVGAVGGGVLMLCLAEKISPKEVEAVAAGIVSWHKELAPAGDSTVVFRDSAFADDVAKTNMAAILAQNGLENVRSL